MDNWLYVWWWVSTFEHTWYRDGLAGIPYNGSDRVMGV